MIHCYRRIFPKNIITLSYQSNYVLSEPSNIHWVNVLERDTWLLANVDDKKLGILVTFPEGGKEFMKVAGFHLGETRFIGERQNVLSVKVEQISISKHAEMIPKIREALPTDIRELPIVFL
jgi:hypothetical protein